MVVKIESYFDGERWCARGIGEDIFTQGDTLDQLMENVKEAVALHFDEELRKGNSLSILLLSEAEVGGVSKVASG